MFAKHANSPAVSEWETFCDLCYYYDLWRVRRKNDRGIYDGYHLQNAEEARALVELLNGLERERNEARERVKELTHENESLYRRLESVHEVYRLSSVCRELKAENEKLKQQQQ